MMILNRFKLKYATINDCRLKDSSYMLKNNEFKIRL